MDIYGDDDAIGFVYVWLHRASGKYYIGSHKGKPDDGYTASGKLIRRAIAKHGIEAFTRTIDYIGPDFRQEETDLIAFFDACNCQLSYNLMHVHLTCSISQETRHRLSEAAKRRGPQSHTPESRAKISKNNARKGNSHSVEHRQKLSDSNRGKKRSAETRAKISAAALRQWAKQKNASSADENPVGATLFDVMPIDSSV